NGVGLRHTIQVGGRQSAGKEARMLGLPFWIFWVLVFLARGELGLKGVALAVAVWGALLAGSLNTEMPAYVFVAGQALLDIVLILIVFGGDIRLR
ncbi:MAG: hypothetical protein ACOC8D_01550, partial [bacterium]